MFASDVDAPLAEDPSLIKMKIKSKVQDCYSKLGQIPGILVDKISREKILKELGHQTVPTAPAEDAEANNHQEETKKSAGAEVSMVTQKALHEVEQS